MLNSTSLTYYFVHLEQESSHVCSMGAVKQFLRLSISKKRKSISVGLASGPIKRIRTREAEQRESVFSSKHE